MTHISSASSRDPRIHSSDLCRASESSASVSTSKWQTPGTPTPPAPRTPRSPGRLQEKVRGLGAFVGFFCAKRDLHGKPSSTVPQLKSSIQTFQQCSENRKTVKEWDLGISASELWNQSDFEKVTILSTPSSEKYYQMNSAEVAHGSPHPALMKLQPLAPWCHGAMPKCVGTRMIPWKHLGQVSIWSWRLNHKISHFDLI